MSRTPNPQPKRLILAGFFARTMHPVSQPYKLNVCAPRLSFSPTAARNPSPTWSEPPPPLEPWGSSRPATRKPTQPEPTACRPSSHTAAAVQSVLFEFPCPALQHNTAEHRPPHPNVADRREAPFRPCDELGPLVRTPCLPSPSLDVRGEVLLPGVPFRRSSGGLPVRCHHACKLFDSLPQRTAVSAIHFALSPLSLYKIERRP
jgi:hypothetical protein